MARGKVVMEMCRKINEYGMRAYLHTNGTLFKPWMFEQIFEYNIGGIVMSLDGPTAEINDRIRTGGFDKATAALRKIVEMKRERKSKYPKLAVYATITNLAYDKMVEFVELIHDIGGDDILLEMSMLIVEGEGSAQFELSPEQLAELPKHAKAARERAKELDVPNNFHRYLEVLKHSDGFGRLEEYKAPATGDLIDSMCYEPWGAVAIMPDGKLGPCCAFDLSPDSLSVKDMPLADVWRGEYMNRVRAGMVDGHPPSYCDRCPSNLYDAKESCREVCVRAIQDKRDWEHLGKVARAKNVVSRAAALFRKHGPIGGISHALLKTRMVLAYRRAAMRH
jgi:MoaA/NifB/PqqE/SkfB family radical SAM enzyme